MRHGGSAGRGGRWLASVVLLVSAHVARAAIDADDCASCHQSIAAQSAATGDHAVVLDCASCHADRRPGRIGPRHRAIAQCADCHEETVHPKSAGGKPRRTRRNCLTCHDPHGSTNRSLVRTPVVFRHKVLQVDFTSDAGAGPGGFTDPSHPGTGLCETCHRKTDFYRHDGTGAPHYGDTCTLCHLHAVNFDPIATPQNCAICHDNESTLHALPSAHAAIACDTCHAEVSPTPGKGHRAIEQCESCHQDRATHAPPGIAPFPCVQCHDAHGSTNTQLVREMLTTPAGAMVTISFDSLAGLADGSFASKSKPGTGICEACHTTTMFYRADGSGSGGHFTFSCLPCHLHTRGFEPPPP